MSCCRLCLFEWSEESIIPRVLLCGHTFCENFFICNQCQVQYGYQDVRDSPINRALLELLDEIRQKNGQLLVNVDVRENGINQFGQGLGDQIKQQLQFESMRKKGNQMEDQINQDQDNNNQQQPTQYAKADDICMIEDCNNLKVYQYGKKQIFCEKCSNKNSANIFNQNNQQDQVLPYGAVHSQMMFYPQNITQNGNTFQTPLQKEKQILQLCQPNYSNSTTINNTNIQTQQIPQSQMNAAVSQTAYPSNMNFSSPPQNIPHSRVLFQTPQYDNTKQSYKNASLNKISYFNSTSDMNPNSLKTQLQF